MKTKLLIVAIGLAAGLSNAATVTVSAGLPSAGTFVSTDGVSASYFFAVGNWNTLTSTWTTFGAPVSITGELKGSVIATSPASLNNEIVNVFVGTASTPQTCANGSFVILTSAGGTTLFPADVTTSAAVTFNASNTTAASLLHSGNAQNKFAAAGAPAGSAATLNLVVVPETSVALLGALGALGLLRRRR